MFTGIVTDIGTLTAIEQLDEGKRFTIQTAFDIETIDLGASIAHSGICLTVVNKSADNNDRWYQVEAWEEALRLSNLGSWQLGQKINLERSLRIGDELGGHLVSGHGDGQAKVVAVKEEGQATRFTLQAPDALAKFIAPKGSVTLDGTSLTVNGVDGSRFDILLIKHTLEVTTWGTVKIGDNINIEIDQMARYAARLSQYS
ncbi:MAG: riboflavin synthase [Hyphomicrobiales bacterium]|nr:riboflavin synthase [Hyphomicrobiales bacterium]